MPEPASPDSRRRLLQTLPSPLAQALKRAHNEKNAQAKHNAAYGFFEATLKLAACAQIGTYVSLGAPDAALNKELENLARASLGTWFRLLYTIAEFVSKRPDAALIPLAGVHARLRKAAPLPAAAAFLNRADGNAGQRQGKISPYELFDALVAYRNRVLGHGAQRETGFYEADAPLILDAAIEAIETLQPFGELHLAFSRDVPVESTGETVRRFMVLTGDGLVDTVDGTKDDASTPAGRLWLISGGARVPLHPLAICEAGEPMRFGYLNRVVRQDKGSAVVVRGCEYLDYYSGDRLQSRDAGQELAALFTALLGAPVTVADVNRLAGAEDGADIVIAPKPGNAVIGDYELLGELGRGGMGIVYKARQQSLNRVVALKVLPPSLSGDPVRVARFRREVRALARCDHPNVVKVISTGEDGDRMWYAMEYVEGSDLAGLFEVLAKWGSSCGGDLREAHLAQAISSASEVSRVKKEISSGGATDDVEAVQTKIAAAIPAVPKIHEGRDYYVRLAEVMAEAAEGVQHLHDNGVIHRDLKPGNIMLTSDGKRAVVMDLGLALLQDASVSLTRSQDKVVGTLRYMPPEQADLQLREEMVDARSDVYSLGATLYELATLAPIFEAPTEIQLLEKVQRKEPVHPRKQNRSIPPDLATIILKATAKDREQRYPRAGVGARDVKSLNLAEDLRAFARNEPIRATPPSAFHYLKLFYRRNRALVGVVSALVTVLAGLWARYSVNLTLAVQRADKMAAEATSARLDADAARFKAERLAEDLSGTLKEKSRALGDAHRNLAQVHLEKAAVAKEHGRFQAEAVHLGAAREEVPESVDRATWISALDRGRGPVWMSDCPFWGFEGKFSLSPDGRLAIGPAGNDARIWDVRTGEIIRTFVGHTKPVTCVVFSPNGRFALSASHDGTLRLWDVHAGTSLQTFEGHTNSVECVAISPDGRLALSGGQDDTMRLWDVETGKSLRTFDGLAYPVCHVAFSPDGRFALSVSFDSNPRLWNIETGQSVRILDGDKKMVWGIAFSPDGRFILSGDFDNTLRLWGTATGQLVRTFEGHTGPVSSVAFSPDGRFALLASSDKTARLWDVGTGTSLRTFEGHASEVSSVAFSPDGRFAVSSGDDQTVRVWEVDTGKSLRELEGHGQGITSVVFGPGSRFALSGSADGTLFLWDLERGSGRRRFQGHTARVNGVALSPDGRLALSASDDQTVRLWDVETGAALRKFEGHVAEVSSVAFSPDGRFAISGSRDKTLRLWDLETGKSLRTFEGHTESVCDVAFSPDGRSVLSGSWDKTMRLWDVETGQVVRTFDGNMGEVHCVAFSPDGRSALSACHGTVFQWDLETGKSIRMFEGHKEDVTSIAFGRDGRLLLTGSYDKTMRLWDVETGKSLRLFEGHSGTVNSVAFSPDGRLALSAGEDRTLFLWDVDPGSSLRTFEGHTSSVRSVTLSPDGHFALSGSNDKTLRLWDVETGKSLRTLEGHGFWVISVAMSPDGRFALSGSQDKTLRLWDLKTGSSLRTFEGHTDGIWCVAIGPDGRHALSASSDGTLRLWDLETGKSLRTLEGHTTAVMCVAFTPDGRQAISGSADQTLRLWDLETGKPVRTFDSHGDRIVSMALSPDGRLVLTGSMERSLRLWNVEPGKSLQTFPGHSGFVMGVAFSPDGRIALSASADHSLRLWDLDSGVLLRTLEDRAFSMTSVVFSRDGRFALSGSQDKTLQLWDMNEILALQRSAIMDDPTAASRVSGLVLKGLEPEPALPPAGTPTWTTADGLPPPFLRAPLPAWLSPRETAPDETTRTWLAEWEALSRARVSEIRACAARNWNDQFDGYRTREEPDGSGGVKRVPVPPRQKDDWGRYQGEPVGTIDWPRYWKECVAPRLEPPKSDPK